MSTGTISHPQDSTQNLPAVTPPRLPYHPLVEERFGIDKASWKALVEAVFPTATTVDSVILALSYCRARNLDPFKRNVHIVPIWNSELRRKVDTVWPGIGELRTTAFRTGTYAGRGNTVFGPDIEQQVGSVKMRFPEWAQVTMRRLVEGQAVDFAGPSVYWLETYAQKTSKDPTPNSMWQKRPRGQLEKCSEAAALRAAFPEELGNEYTNDEAGSIQLGSPLNVESTVAVHEDGRSPSDRIADQLESASGGNGDPHQEADSEQGEASPEVPADALDVREGEEASEYVSRLLVEIVEAGSEQRLSQLDAAASKALALGGIEDQHRKVVSRKIVERAKAIGEPGTKDEPADDPPLTSATPSLTRLRSVL